MSPGQKLAPHLEVVRKLGQGAMGKLWVAHDTQLGRDVAVKVLSYGLDRDPKSVRRFQREYETASAINSRHVVRMLDHGQTEEGVPYIVMEHLEGESLETRLEREKTLSLDDTLELVRQVCDALDAAHAQGIVHRDVKPDNILLLDESDTMEIKVLDFGLAKPWVRQTLTGSGMAMGTPDFMSPEQVLGGKHVDHRADIWSLGVVAYQCLFGRVPFKADNVQALMFVICRADFKRPSELGAPAELDAWFDRALRPDKDERFTSAGEMSVALELLVASLDVQDGEATALDIRATREMSRSRPKVTEDTAVTPVLDMTKLAPQLADDYAEEKTVVQKRPTGKQRSEPPPLPPSRPSHGEHPDTPSNEGRELASLADDSDDEHTRALPKRATEAAEDSPPDSEAAATADAIPVPDRRAINRVLFALIAVGLVALAAKRGWIGSVWPEGMAGRGAVPTERPSVVGPTASSPIDDTASATYEVVAPPTASASAVASAVADEAYLSIRCRPSCAVWIDKLSLGNSPVDKAAVPTGPSRVVVYRAGIGSKVLKIDLRPGEHASYEVLMKDMAPAPPAPPTPSTQTQPSAPHPRATPPPDAETAPSTAPTELGVTPPAPQPTTPKPEEPKAE